jgi:hypothetical protein
MGCEPEWFKLERGYVPHDQPGELFNVREDASERVNHFANQPERVREMMAMLREAQSGPRAVWADAAQLSE